MSEFYHTPVLLEESMEMLGIKPSGVYVDATLGGGGHSRAILSRLGESGRLIVFDQDPEAVVNAPQDERVTAVLANFRFVHNYVRYLGYDGVDGILADLGVSSHQFDTPERGFSFRFDADLDMRMNTSSGQNAADILNSYDEESLAGILRLYGEVESCRKAASLICSARSIKPIKTTTDLNNALKSILPAAAPHKFLAKVYQALRIEVNGEMRCLEHFLTGTDKSLKPGGTAVIITYHSLEDRMVKNFFKTGNVEGKDTTDLYGRKDCPFDVIDNAQHKGQKRETEGRTEKSRMKKEILENVLGGQVLARRGLTKNWKFIIYIFILVLVYISIHFWTRNTMQRIARNEETLRNLRSEYMGKYTRLLYTGKRGEIEQLLEENGLELLPPDTPPTRINLKED